MYKIKKHHDMYVAMNSKGYVLASTFSAEKAKEIAEKKQAVNPKCCQCIDCKHCAQYKHCYK